ncbi:Flp pilus assembly protein TadB [Granulicella sibirica]|uniref:Flp pilus assembly protein TadB n=2 Tax=Granulicella sibirica TaxID=2479048 RepID=A0A4Q0T5V1_9BACT|nr:Flp pilus assembly protein TadB [Granulicella sibirica]
MMSRALRAGHSMSAAIGIVAEGAAEPAGSAFGEVFRQQKFGLPMRDSLSELVRHYPSQDLKVLVTAILVQRDSGGNLVQILDRTSAVIRERLKLQGDVRVHTAQGRLTGWILCLLPILMLGMLALTNPGYVSVLFNNPLGQKLMYGAACLLCLGGYLIHRIVKAIEV